MNLFDKIKSMILSKTVNEKERKLGVEIESFYYNQGSLTRIPVNKKGQYSATDLLTDLNKVAANYQYTYSLEPGGQLEWASSPQISLWDIVDEYLSSVTEFYDRKSIKRDVTIYLLGDQTSESWKALGNGLKSPKEKGYLK